MWAEDVAVPPDGEWRTQCCVHKHTRRFGFFPLPGPPNRKAELRGADAEGFSGPRLLLADDFLNGQGARCNEPHIPRILVKFIEGFRCCCDRRGTFENVWLHGKMRLTYLWHQQVWRALSRLLQISCCKLKRRSLLTTCNLIQSHV